MDDIPRKASPQHVNKSATGKHTMWQSALIVILLVAAALVGLVALAMAPAAPRAATNRPVSDQSQEAIWRDGATIAICAMVLIVVELGRVAFAMLERAVP